MNNKMKVINFSSINQQNLNRFWLIRFQKGWDLILHVSLPWTTNNKLIIPSQIQIKIRTKVISVWFWYLSREIQSTNQLISKQRTQQPVRDET